MQAEVVELADALDSKSSGSNTMRVRFPPSAPDATSNAGLGRKHQSSAFLVFGWNLDR